MSRRPGLLFLWAVAMAPGCGVDQAPAAARPVPRENRGEETVSGPGTSSRPAAGGPSSPGGRLAAAEPDAARPSPEKIVVEIEAAEVLERGESRVVGQESRYSLEGAPPPGGNPAPELAVLALKVTVTNHYETVKLRVNPAGFVLEGESGKTFKAFPSAARRPPLKDHYLKGSRSVSGWLFYRVPRGEQKLTLRSELRRPSIQLLVPVTLR